MNFKKAIKNQFDILGEKMTEARKTNSCEEILERLDEIMGGGNSSVQSQQSDSTDCALDEWLNP